MLSSKVNFHMSNLGCSDNRGARIIQVRIREVQLYHILYIVSRNRYVLKFPYVQALLQNIQLLLTLTMMHLEWFQAIYPTCDRNTLCSSQEHPCLLLSNLQVES